MRGRGTYTVLCLLLMVSACGVQPRKPPSSRHTTPVTGPPTTPRECNHLRSTQGDPGILAGFHWDSREHAYGVRVTLYVCVDPHSGGVVTLEPLPDRITATPGQVAVAGDGTGVLPFTITVQRGAAGPLGMRQLYPTGKLRAEFRGPRIAGQAGGWHFAVAS